MDTQGTKFEVGNTYQGSTLWDGRSYQFSVLKRSKKGLLTLFVTPDNHVQKRYAKEHLSGVGEIFDTLLHGTVSSSSIVDGGADE